MEQVLKIILEKIKKTPEEFQAYEDLYYMCKEAMKEDSDDSTKTAISLNDGAEMVYRSTYRASNCRRS